ncbi:MAG: hypothetical protein N2255_00015 [Kiritimatiellae bacterium]|nr:hypothetical protein [Kiritimatiellia bacterium]
MAKRYWTVVGAYAAATVTALSLTLVLDYCGLVSYFGGDAAGS